MRPAAFTWWVDDVQMDEGHGVTRCDCQLLQRLKTVDRKTVQRRISAFVYGGEIGALLSRRTKIVTLPEKAGPAALFDR